MEDNNITKPIVEENTTKPSASPMGFSLSKEEEATLAKDTQQFINKGTKIIHSEKTRDAVLNNLKGSGNVLDKVANTTVHIVNRIDQISRQAGTETHDLVKIQGSLDLLQQVVEVGEASGTIPKLTPEQIQTAFSIAVEKYIKGEIQAGRIDPKALQEEMARGIKEMPPEEQKALDGHLKGINRTALASTGVSVNESSNNQPKQGLL